MTYVILILDYFTLKFKKNESEEKRHNPLFYSRYPSLGYGQKICFNSTLCM